MNGATRKLAESPVIVPLIGEIIPVDTCSGSKGWSGSKEPLSGSEEPAAAVTAAAVAAAVAAVAAAAVAAAVAATAVAAAAAAPIDGGNPCRVDAGADRGETSEEAARLS